MGSQFVVEYYPRHISVLSQQYLAVIEKSPKSFVSDIEHFGNQTDVERRVKITDLSEGLMARVSVI